MAQVKLTWVASTDAVDGYNIYRSVTAGTETTKLNSALVVGTTFTDTAPLAGKNFYVAKSSLGGVESLSSNEISAVLLPAPPTQLVAQVI